MDIQEANWEPRPQNGPPSCTRATCLATVEGGGWTMDILLGSNGQHYRHTKYTDGRPETWERLGPARI